MKNIADRLFEIYIELGNFHTAESMADNEQDKLKEWGRFYEAFGKLETLYNELSEETK